MPSILDELAFSIRDSRAILFVGAGLSMSVGLPSWQQLIEHMQSELGIEAGSAAAETSYQTLAEFYRLHHGSIGPLRSWEDISHPAQEAGRRVSRRSREPAPARQPRRRAS